jgi:serine/threonine protein kinase
MFTKDPEERINMAEIIKHDWVTSNGVNPFPKQIFGKFEVTQGE